MRCKPVVEVTRHEGDRANTARPACCLMPPPPTRGETRPTNRPAVTTYGVLYGLHGAVCQPRPALGVVQFWVVGLPDDLPPAWCCGLRSSAARAGPAQVATQMHPGPAADTAGRPCLGTEHRHPGGACPRFERGVGVNRLLPLNFAPAYRADELAWFLRHLGPGPGVGLVALPPGLDGSVGLAAAAWALLPVLNALTTSTHLAPRCLRATGPGRRWTWPSWLRAPCWCRSVAPAPPQPRPCNSCQRARPAPTQWRPKPLHRQRTPCPTRPRKSPQEPEAMSAFLFCFAAWLAMALAWTNTTKTPWATRVSARLRHLRSAGWVILLASLWLATRTPACCARLATTWTVAPVRPSSGSTAALTWLPPGAHRCWLALVLPALGPGGVRERCSPAARQAPDPPPLQQLPFS